MHGGFAGRGAKTVTMNPGDLLYGNVDSRPLCIYVRGTGGKYWNFATSVYETATTWDSSKYTLPLTVDDPGFPYDKTVVIPGAAAMDPAAKMVEALQGQSSPGACPLPTQCYWIGGLGGASGVTLATARGATIRFTG